MKEFLLAVVGCVAISLVAALVLTNIDSSTARIQTTADVRLD